MGSGKSRGAGRMSAGYAGRADAGLPFLSRAARRFQAGLGAYRLDEHRYTIVGMARQYFKDTEDHFMARAIINMGISADAGNRERTYSFALLLEKYDSIFAKYLRSDEIKYKLLGFGKSVYAAHIACSTYYRGMKIEEIWQTAMAGKVSEKNRWFKYGASLSANWYTAHAFSREIDSVVAEYEKDSSKKHAKLVEYSTFSSILPMTVRDIENDPSLGAHWAEALEARLMIGTPIWTKNSPAGVHINRLYISESNITNHGKQKIKEAAWLLGAEVTDIG